MAPILLALASLPAIHSTLVATGQHGSLLEDALKPFGIWPDHRLETGFAGLDPDAMATAMEATLVPLIRQLQPQMVLVQGDTTSALAAARAAVSCNVPVGHMEAGLRSHDLQRPWPEEGNRIAIDRLSTLLFAPTTGNLANLAADGEIKGDAHVTGNSGIDALLHVHRTLPEAIKREGNLSVLVTLHRRETIGEPLHRICMVLRELADQGSIAITLPLHPNPRVRDIIEGALGGHPAIALAEPFSYPEMVARMSAADLILSDSGGVQEEAPALGVPLLILRDVTERQEAVDCGAAILASTEPDKIRSEFVRLIEDHAARAAMAVPRFPFGRGDAAARVVAVIENYLRSQNVT